MGGEIFDLPREILVCILGKQALSVADLCNFGLTCKTFHELVTISAQELWRNKFRNTWPDLYTLISDQFDTFCNVDWREESLFRVRLEQPVIKELQLLSPRYFAQKSLLIWYSDLKDIMRLAEMRRSAPIHLWDILRFILNDRPNERLTMKYYAEEVVRELLQQYHWLLIPEVTKMIKEDALIDNYPPCLPLAIGAQWLKPYQLICYDDVARKLDALSSRVMTSFAANHPRHWVLRENREWWVRRKSGLWGYNGPKTAQKLRHYLGGMESELPKTADNDVAMKFIMNYLLRIESWRVSGPENQSLKDGYIDEVLDARKGWAITIAAVICSVALRFGIVCRLRLPRGESWRLGSHEVGVVWLHFSRSSEAGMLCSELGSDEIVIGGALIWRSFAAGVPETALVQTVDSLMLGWCSCTISSSTTNWSRRLLMTSLKSTRLLSSLVLRSIPQASEMIKPIFRETRPATAKNVPFTSVFHPNFFSTWLEPREVSKMCEGLSMSGRLFPDTWKVTKRSEMRRAFENSLEVTFAIGMIMHHKRYDYICVIYRWDESCKASRDWQQENRVHQLPLQNKQPFYNVLVCDGSERYVAQENLEMPNRSGITVTNSEVPRYFDAFKGDHYLPNEELMKMFPEDEAVRESFLKNHVHLANK
ncbi:unnamed protein product [Notodromas monacha]|uniref:Hemimethylated DNA-binding domain-containing protein n=1 Tax=Notodromas monacha TaxID=399045 RepID=A0A7R9GEY6_9CRUS|nr:unnamed protein product [Notodromas monacha]CAG0918325.1 unnamed protein product [Notodromas monacha]